MHTTETFTAGNRVIDSNGFAGTITEVLPNHIRVCFDDEKRGRIVGRNWHVNPAHLTAL